MLSFIKTSTLFIISSFFLSLNICYAQKAITPEPYEDEYLAIAEMEKEENVIYYNHELKNEGVPFIENEKLSTHPF